MKRRLRPGDEKMTKLLILPVTALGLTLLAAVLPIGPVVNSAHAQDSGSTSYDFEDDLVQGDLVRPDGENLMVRRKGARESLIKIREHFIPELLKSVENL
jgi:hypothetical protein